MYKPEKPSITICKKPLEKSVDIEYNGIKVHITCAERHSSKNIYDEANELIRIGRVIPPIKPNIAKSHRFTFCLLEENNSGKLKRIEPNNQDEYYRDLANIRSIDLVHPGDLEYAIKCLTSHKTWFKQKEIDHLQSRIKNYMKQVFFEYKPATTYQPNSFGSKRQREDFSDIFKK